MERFTDYYAVLGVDANAPTEGIKKAFKHLALQYHPDVYKGEDAEARMRELLLAYQTLIDPERRRRYDLSRSEHVPGSSVPRENTTDVSPTARRDRQRSYAFPVLNDGAPAQIDLGEITYLLSPLEVRRLKEQGMVRGAKTPSMASRLTADVLSTLSGARLARVPAAALPALPCCLRKRANSLRDWFAAIW